MKGLEDDLETIFLQTATYLTDKIKWNSTDELRSLQINQKLKRMFQEQQNGHLARKTSGPDKLESS